MKLVEAPAHLWDDSGSGGKPGPVPQKIVGLRVYFIGSIVVPFWGLGLRI